jgi:hypothetical protein
MILPSELQTLRGASGADTLSAFQSAPGPREQRPTSRYSIASPAQKKGIHENMKPNASNYSRSAIQQTIKSHSTTRKLLKDEKARTPVAQLRRRSIPTFFRIHVRFVLPHLAHNRVLGPYG